MTITELKKKVNLLVAKDRIEEAINLLTEEIQNNQMINEIILQSAKYTDVKNQVRQGRLNHESASQEMSIIRKNILELLSAIEEEAKFKEDVFKNDESADIKKDGQISVFLSVGTPHNDAQKKYIQRLKNILEKENIKLETLGSTFWVVKSPLNAIRKKLKEVAGCIILAMERTYVKTGIHKRNSLQETFFEDEFQSTSWNHLEGGMAYQMSLPMLILKEKKLKAEGVFDGGIHEWSVIRINVNNPDELNEAPFKPLIHAWIKEVVNLYNKK